MAQTTSGCEQYTGRSVLLLLLLLLLLLCHFWCALMAKLPVAGLVWQSVEFLKKSWNLLSNFPDMEKVWKMEIKSGKIVKSLEFFSKLRQLLYNLFWFWSNLNRSRPYVWKKALFMRFLWSLLITYLINSSVEKESIVLEKSLEKVLNFGSTTFSTLL